jgi:hypothetical protein
MKVKRTGRRTALWCLAGICISLCFCTAEAGKEKTTAPLEVPWVRFGPGGGGVQENATVNPGNPLNVFVSCNMSGAYVTYDGGRKWNMFNLGGTIRDFEFDRSSDSTVYASNDNGLYRSEDLGQNWSLIYPSPEDIVSIELVGDHAERTIVTGDGMPDGPVDLVRVDPDNSDHLVLGITPPWKISLSRSPYYLGDSVRVLVSGNKGADWRQCGRVEGKRVLYISMGQDSDGSNVLTVITEKAGARIWEDTARMEILRMPPGSLLAADGRPGDADRVGVLYVLTEMEEDGGRVRGGMYKSTDCGGNWVQVNDGLLDGWSRSGQLPEFKTFAICAGNPEIAYLSCDAFHVKVDGGIQRQFGMLKTVSGGKQWQWVYRANDNEILSGNFNGSWINRDYGPEWGETPRSLAVSATDGNVCFVTDDGRTYYTVDGGTWWQQCYSSIDPESGSFSSTGLDVTTNYGVHFDPFDKNHFLVSYTDIGMFQTHDYGKTWLHSVAGIPLKWSNTCYWAEFDPDVKDRIWSVWASCHDLPRFKMLRSGALRAGKFAGGVAVSNDGGQQWKIINNGIPDGTVLTHLVLDPSSSAESRTLYACGFSRGVFKSTDGGRQWSPANTGIENNLNAWRMLLLPGGKLFLLVARDLRDGKVVDGAIYCSENGAESWKSMPMPEGANAPNDLIADPQAPGRMYLSCWPRTVEGREVNGGLFLTEDGGESWRQIFREEAHVYAAALDPSSPSTIYLNTFDMAAFGSIDRGENWHKLEGYDFKWGHRPVPDPHNPGMLFLTTFGGGLQYGAGWQSRP